MGFGTGQQIGNRLGSGGPQPLPPQLGGGGIFPGSTGLADIFRNSIGAPQQIGATQQPNQLFTLLQSLLGGQGGQPGMQPPEQTGGATPPFGSPPQIGGGVPPQQGGLPFQDPQITPPQPGGGFGGGTSLSGITAQPPQFGGGTGIGGGFGAGTNLSNPFGSLINQRFAR